MNADAKQTRSSYRCNAIACGIALSACLTSSYAQTTVGSKTSTAKLVTTVVVPLLLGDPAPPISNSWTWISGSQAPAASGVYGANSANVPGARENAATWSFGYLFGGAGKDSNGVTGQLNDLWVFVPDYNQWLWLKGSNAVNAIGVYGTRGVGSVASTPGAREGAITWSDGSGNLWLFGGYGIDATGVTGELNDLWSFSLTTRQWTWISGSNLANASGVYNTKGTSSVSGVPGARQQAVSWSDNAGNLWLFGGHGVDSRGNSGALNDLWRYSINTGQWTWMSGSVNYYQAGVYGTQGTATATNVPGARYSAVSWSDGAGNLWVFGGIGTINQGATLLLADLNDLWRFSIGTGQWTWMTGSSVDNAVGVYGTKGIPSASNTPGSRQLSVSWTDRDGNFWLFGGYENIRGTISYRNDMWRFTPSTGQWTWMSGSDGLFVDGVYGTKGVASVSNMPGARFGSKPWTDSTGNLWLFGGDILANFGIEPVINDLWKYVP